MSFSQRLLSGRANSSFHASFGLLVAVAPVVVWANDSLFSLCKVQESSMEPTLFSGDILVVRKADGIWQRWKLPTTRGTSKTTKDEENDDLDETLAKREQILAYEREHCNSNGTIGLLRKPPTPIPGDIVVFKNPDRYPDRWNIERVLATGGETVRPTIRHNADGDQPLHSSPNKDTRIVFVPPYYIWVEGDNHLTTSTDESLSSSGHGAVSKKLLVGVAEYRVWPPWRIGKLYNQHIADKTPSKEQT